MGRVLTLAAGAAAIAGIAYSGFALTRVRAFRRAAQRAHGEGGSTVPITVLKPLHGEEPHLRENLRSFCDQDYPEFQLIFCAADAADPALAAARTVAQQFPQRDIEIIAGNAVPAGNPKIGNLLGVMDRVKHPIVAIADSDICAGRSYLRALARCFDDPQAGAATCIYGGVPEENIVSQLGAMHVNDQFAPSVMVANAIEPLTYCFGATMAFRTDVLREIGGLQAVAPYLADDYLLGKLVSDAGLRVALVPQAVQTAVSDRSIQALWKHEVRWARAILGQRPAGYAGSVVTYALPFAALFALGARSLMSLAVLVLALLLRVALHYEARKAFAPQTRATPWLIPLRDALGLGVWTAAFFGKRVEWRSGVFDVDAGGRMAAGPKEM